MIKVERLYFAQTGRNLNKSLRPLSWAKQAVAQVLIDFNNWHFSVKLRRWKFAKYYVNFQASFELNKDYSTAPLSDDLTVAIDPILWPEFAQSKNNKNKPNRPPRRLSSVKSVIMLLRKT